MTDYTNPPGMPAIEFKTVREWLAVTSEWLAAYLNVDHRTVRNWESGKYAVPDGVRLQMKALEALTRQAVITHVEELKGEPEPRMVTYRTDEDYWATLGEGEIQWSASWHRRVAARVREEVPGLVIVEVVTE